MHPAIFRLLPGRLRERLVRSRVHIDENELRSLTVKEADTVAELEAVARLAHEAYVSRGIMAPHPAGVRVTPHFLCSTTRTFIAKRGEVVVGALSLSMDRSPLPVPMDKIYRPQVDALRARKRKIGEIGGLCIAKGSRRLGISFLLNKIVLRSAGEIYGLDDVVIAVHPDAEEFYRATMHFETVGPVCEYPGLSKSALAVAMRLDLNAWRFNCFRAWGHMPKTASKPFNPFYMYFERQDAQITFPQPTVSASIRRAVADRLLALAPDALAELSADEIALVRGHAPVRAKPVRLVTAAGAR
jgi:hypothetical protein